MQNEARDCLDNKTSLKAFIEKHKNHVLRYWIKKDMWTPYEMDLKDSCQSDLYNDECSYGYFTDCFNLGNGDWLIEITSTNWQTTDYCSKYYYRLSKLDIEYISTDQEEGDKRSDENY